MAKPREAGIFQLENGNWSYRYHLTVDGKKKEYTSRKDSFGNPLRTKREAIKARDASREMQKRARAEKPQPTRRTMKEIYQEFCDKGRNDRAYTTKLKQDSLWNNHLCEKYGDRFVDEITVAEINDYLSELYYQKGLSYRYTEGFLKMFYLIFGQAYSRNHLDLETYNKLCKNKDTKIHMPKMKDEDDTEIVAFNKEEIAVLDDYFRGTNAETAYLLGKYCGLRINECYGLKWDKVNLEEGTIFIDRQMQYQEGLIKLVPVKTHNGKRKVYLCSKMLDYLRSLAVQREDATVTLSAIREQNQTFITDLDGSKISSTELVNCLSNGKIQTVNSMKFHSRTIKTALSIDFKYHYLRHTYGTRMAELNTPEHLLCDQMSFTINALPASEKQIDGLHRIVQTLETDENESHILEVQLPNNDDPETIQVAHFEDGYYLGLKFPMADFGWEHPLVLAGTGFTCTEIEEVLDDILVELVGTDEISIISNGVRDVTGEFYGGGRMYYGRFTSDGELIAAGKFIGGALSLYGPDGKFHYDQRYDKQYYEGEFDEISDEEFEQFKKEMDELGKKK